MNENLDIYNEFLRGNPRGLKAISIAYWEPLILYGLRYISRRDIVEDAANEALHLLADNIGSFQNATHIKKFLRRTVWNKCQNELRKLDRVKSYIDDRDELEYNASESTDINEFSVHSQLIMEEMVVHLNKLPQKRRHDLKAFFLDSMSYEEIAKKRGVTADSVRQNLKHGLKDLRKYLKDKGYAQYLKKVGFFSSKKLDL